MSGEFAANGKPATNGKKASPQRPNQILDTSLVTQTPQPSGVLISSRKLSSQFFKSNAAPAQKQASIHASLNVTIDQPSAGRDGAPPRKDSKFIERTSQNRAVLDSLKD